MKEFRWNEIKESIRFWDSDKGQQYFSSNSDKDTINNSNGVKFEDGLQALMNVVSELIDIEEHRAKIETGRIKNE